MSSGSHINIDKLNGENYEIWKQHMEAILIKIDLWDYVNGKNRPYPAADNSAWEKNDNKARAEIILALSPDALCHVQNFKTSRQVWEKLKKVYKSKGPARKTVLLKELLSIKLSNGGSMQNHLNKFFNCVDKLRQIDIQVADIMSIILLYSIPNAYEEFRCAIESQDLLPTPETLKIRLLEEATSRQKSKNRSRSLNTMQNNDSNHQGGIMCIMCNCGQPAQKLTVRKEGPNKGREFFGCPQGPGSPCSFFEWADSGSSSNHSNNNNNWGNSPRGGSSGRGRGRGAAQVSGGKRKCGNCGVEGHTKKICQR